MFKSLVVILSGDFIQSAVFGQIMADISVLLNFLINYVLELGVFTQKMNLSFYTQSFLK